MKFEIIEHTADIGIKAYGKTLGELFESAAFAMFSLMTDIEKLGEVGEFEVVLESEDRDGLMVDWLSQLLYIHEVDDVLLGSFDVLIKEKDGIFKLKGTVKGEKLDREKHELKLVIKAVTYHMLEVNEKEGYAKVLFDI